MTRSRRWLTQKGPACLALCALLGSVVCAYVSRKNEEGLIASEPEHDLGRLAQGTVTSADFTLANQGSKQAQITGVRKSCDCARVELTKRLLQPGETTKVTVTWNIGSQRGKVSSEILITFLVQGAGHEWQTPLTMRAEVDPDFNYSPSELVFGGKSTRTQSVYFAPGRLQKVELLEAFCDQRAFQARVIEGESRVEVSFDPALWPSGRSDAQLTVRTASRNEKFARIGLSVVDGSQE